MQFVLLLHEDETAWASLSDEDQKAGIAEHFAFVAALQANNAFAAGAPLAPAGTGKLVTMSGVQDGPFADSKEQIGGFYMIECADMNAALEWARQCPTAKSGRVEVRPVPDYGG